ncbi:M24 family metallopeptidase [Leuconostoc pseudomesenteroides]
MNQNELLIVQNELKNRLEKLKEKIVQLDLDAYVLTDPEDVWYLSNIEYSPEQRPFLLVIYPTQDPMFIVPRLEVNHVKVPYFEFSIQEYFDVTSKEGLNWFDVTSKELKSLKKVGIETNGLINITYSTPDINWEGHHLLQDQRMIKSNNEINKIKYVANMCSRVVNQTLDIVKTGTTVLETYSVPMKYESQEIAKHFSTSNRTTNAVWPADFSYMPHSIPNMNATIGSGPNVDISIFKLQGYAAECERTFFTETPTEEEKKHFEQMMQARKLFLNTLKPGNKASDIEAIVDKYFVQEGVSKNVLHRPGHGIGLNNHEWPTLSLGNDMLLKPNMVISVEPAIYFEGKGGYRHSDTVLITETGYELLTKAPVELNELILK